MDAKIPKDVNEFIAGFPLKTQKLLKQLRATIKKAAPEAQEGISYRMPVYKLNGVVLYFSGFKNHIGLYPLPTGVEAFKKELSMHKGAKGSVQFPIDEPLPIDLISRIVKFRVKQNLKKANLKKA